MNILVQAFALPSNDNYMSIYRNLVQDSQKVMAACISQCTGCKCSCSRGREEFDFEW